MKITQLALPHTGVKDAVFCMNNRQAASEFAFYSLYHELIARSSWNEFENRRLVKRVDNGTVECTIKGSQLMMAILEMDIVKILDLVML